MPLSAIAAAAFAVSVSEYRNTNSDTHAPQTFAGRLHECASSARRHLRECLGSVHALLNAASFITAWFAPFSADYTKANINGHFHYRRDGSVDCESPREDSEDARLIRWDVHSPLIVAAEASTVIVPPRSGMAFRKQ